MCDNTYNLDFSYNKQNKKFYKQNKKSYKHIPKKSYKHIPKKYCMCSFETVANNTNTSCKFSSSEKPQKLILLQQWNQKTVFEDLQFL
jgi:hypothetical protein